MGTVERATEGLVTVFALEVLEYLVGQCKEVLSKDACTRIATSPALDSCLRYVMVALDYSLCSSVRSPEGVRAVKTPKLGGVAPFPLCRCRESRLSCAAYKLCSVL